MDKDFKNKLVKFHDKNYKLLLLIPAVLLIFSILYLGFFYSNNGDILVPDKELKQWKPSNPEGYVKWFEAHAALIPIIIKKIPAQIKIPPKNFDAL